MNFSALSMHGRKMWWDIQMKWNKQKKTIDFMLSHVVHLTITCNKWEKGGDWKIFFLEKIDMQDIFTENLSSVLSNKGWMMLTTFLWKFSVLHEHLQIEFCYRKPSRGQALSQDGIQTSLKEDISSFC